MKSSAGVKILVVALGAVIIASLAGAILHLTVWQDLGYFVPRRYVGRITDMLDHSAVQTLERMLEPYWQAQQSPRRISADQETLDALSAVSERVIWETSRRCHLLFVYQYKLCMADRSGYLDGVLDPSASDAPDAIYEALLFLRPATVRMYDSSHEGRQHAAVPSRTWDMSAGDLILFSKDMWTNIEWDGEAGPVRFALGTCPLPRKMKKLRNERQMFTRRWARQKK